MLLDPKKEAQLLLGETWSGKGFPVDPVTISRSLGLQVVDTTLPTSVSGALIKEKGKDPIIVLHSSDSKNRKRFSCAHELGHYISRVKSESILDEYDFIDLRSPSSSNGTDREEVFANQFAASLLMPCDEFRKALRKTDNKYKLSSIFGVSIESISYRIKSIG